MRRREFLIGTAAAPVVAPLSAMAAGERVSIVQDPADPIAGSAPVQWALKDLNAALALRRYKVARFTSVNRAPKNDLCIQIAGDNNAAGGPEAFEVAVSSDQHPPLVLETGGGERGLMYAVLYLAGQIRNPGDSVLRPHAASPAHPVRGVMRLFTSEVEDKPWFYDREMWPAYFEILAKQRFNRFQLAFGIGYDFLREVTDAYFLFAYPFLVDVPGYKVRAVGLPDAERDRNLETLQYIGEQSAAHGIHFQLGLWMHGYEWANSPDANYAIEGLTTANHGPYCRDALAALLRSCPQISGVTFRIHGESGVTEGSYDFWKTVFDGVVRSGRSVEIDMHAKGIDDRMIQAALATGLPVRVSPKFWAEHMGMPYHQAAIRELEMPHGERTGLMALSTGTRSFTRYSYADLLREDRRYSVMFRVWPGTQRLLLWADPLTASAYSRAFEFCGADGVELFEPLSFKGRRGSGKTGGRCGYAQASLNPKWDWQKYLATYAVWGSALYSPGPATAQAIGARSDGEISRARRNALALASRILPIVTSSYGPSAANNTYWPEMYTLQPVTSAQRKNPYGDTPAPKVFGNASPFDPELFLNANEFAGELLKGERSGKYSPADVAQWLEELAHGAETLLRQTRRSMAAPYRRMAEDVTIQIALGRFFAAMFRSAVLFAIHERSGDRGALEHSLKLYRGARDIWAKMAEGARAIYAADITFGEQPWLRGHWIDRLPAIDADIADMTKRLETTAADGESAENVRAAIAAALSNERRGGPECNHTASSEFRAGEPLELLLTTTSVPATARVHYRHVDQGERYEIIEMERRGQAFWAAIPAAYTSAPFPLQYYFEVRRGPAQAWLYPGFAPDRANRPYFVVRRSKENG